MQKNTRKLIQGCALAALALLGAGRAGATPITITDFLIWGQGAASNAATNNAGVFIGPGSTIHGNVGSVGDVQTNGVATLDGNVLTGSQSIYSASTTVSGITTENASTFPVLPSAASFSSGGTDFLGLTSAASVTFTPGTSYGDVQGGGGPDLFFTAGNYYFDSFHLANGTTLHMNLTGGAVKIFVTGEAFFGASTDVELTGGNSSMVSLETHEAGVNAFRVQGGSNWIGNVYAPYGEIHVGSGSGTTSFQGYLWSGLVDTTPSNIRAAVYIEHNVTGYMPDQPTVDTHGGDDQPVPEPATLSLVALGTGLLGLARRKRAVRNA